MVVRRCSACSGAYAWQAAGETACGKVRHGGASRNRRANRVVIRAACGAGVCAAGRTVRGENAWRTAVSGSEECR